MCTCAGGVLLCKKVGLISENPLGCSSGAHRAVGHCWLLIGGCAAWRATSFLFSRFNQESHSLTMRTMHMHMKLQPGWTTEFSISYPAE